MEITNYSTSAFAFVLFCANLIARLYFISSELFSKLNTSFRKIIGRWAIFKQSAFWGRFYKKRLKTSALELRGSGSDKKLKILSVRVVIFNTVENHPFVMPSKC